VDPEGRVEEDVVKQVLKQRAAAGTLDQVVGQLEEHLQHSRGDVRPG